MKIRNLLVLTIAMALSSLCAQAQANDGSMTFTDHLGQSITISSFGTVLSFKDSKGLENATDNYFRIGPYGNNGPFPWIDSRKAAGTSASLKAKFPRPGATLAKGQMLDVTATVHQGSLTVTRRLTWPAGSSVVKTDVTISASSAVVVGTLEETVGGLRDIPCPDPPGEAKCPGDWPPGLKATSGKIELAKQLLISPGKPIHIFFITELTAIPPISRG
jgi:hypothetical protein